MSNKMEIINGIDCSGNDIVHYEVGSKSGILNQNDCQNKCLETDGCNAISYGDNYCWLKSKLGNISKNKSRNCSYKNNKIVHLPGVDLYGNNIKGKQFSNTNAEECLSHCQGNAECNAFVYDKKNNYCLLKNTDGKNINYKVNSDKDSVILNFFQYNPTTDGNKQYIENESDYDKYIKELDSFNDAKLVKSVMERNKKRLGNMKSESTLKSNALEAYKQKLMRQEQQKQTQQKATADSNNINKKLNNAYDKLIYENIDDINKLDHAIDNRVHLINENNKSASEKNKSIYILSYFLLLLLLISVIFLCNFLEIISSRIAFGLSFIGAFLFIFKVVYKYYWNGSGSESVALKKMIYSGYKNVGEDIRDAVLPKWVYSCPKKCKSKKPDYMKLYNDNLD